MDAPTGTPRRGSRFAALVRGLLLGAVVSVIGIVALGLWTPPPADLPMPGRVEVLGTPPATVEQAAPAAAAEQAPPAAAEPAPEQARSAAAELAPEQAPPANAPEALPAAPEPLPSGESPAAEQQTGQPAADGEAVEQETRQPALGGEATQQAPAYGQPEPGQPPVTDELPAEPAPEEPAAMLAPEADAASSAPAPAGSEQPAATGQPADEPGANAASPAPDQAAPEQPPATGQPADQPETGAAAAPATDATAPSGGDGTERGDAAAPEAGTQTAMAAPPPPAGPQGGAETSAQPADDAALKINARAYEAPAGAPLMAVILVAGAKNAITPERLNLLTMPLTVAIRPDAPGSTELGAAARAAGHEVLADLSLTGTPPDRLAERTREEMATLDMAVGATAANGAEDAGRLAPVLDQLQEGGFAWVDTGTGIGTPAERIAREGSVTYTQTNKFVPAGAGEGRISEAIRTAAHQARQWGTSVLILPGDDAALKELVHWGLENDRRPVWFAPISAVIRKRAD